VATDSKIFVILRIEGSLIADFRFSTSIVHATALPPAGATPGRAPRGRAVEVCEVSRRRAAAPPRTPHADRAGTSHPRWHAGCCDAVLDAVLLPRAALECAPTCLPTARRGRR
jgi:hypothetical protein